jgi:pSer/pThr/pTyr-binding forkhead associated (FHA) protein
MSFDTDWLLLSLRLIFIMILYFFLYQIVRLTTRELSILAKTSESTSTTRRNAARLVLIDPAETLLRSGTGFTLEPTTLVGRHPGCTIVLDDSFVSAEHAELERTHEGWLLHDLGSTNGTFVNDQEVAGTRGIGDGDIVQFGRVTMRLVC